MDRKLLGVVPMLVVVASLLTTTAVNAYTLDPYNSSFWDNQDNDCQCIAASVRMELMYTYGTTSVTSQSTINAYAQAHDRGSYTCGSDPQGWAYALWHYTPAGYGFNYYKSTSQATQDWELVYGIRADQHPNGALVAGGAHAIDVVGFYTSKDPWLDFSTLYGFYLLDPWYGRGASGLPSWYNGFSPNYYVTVANWNSLYFTNAGSPWYYTVVLRSSTDAGPHQPPPQSYGDYMCQYSGLSIGASDDTSRSLARPNVAGSIEEAVRDGLRENGLEKGGSLGVDLTGHVVGPSVHVDSLATQVPSYELTEIQVAGQVRAVAMVTEVPGGYSFAAIAPWTGRFDLASPSATQIHLRSQGMSGSWRLVWAWTAEGGSPFTPIIAGTDAATSQTVFLSPSGRHSQLHLAPGLTAR
jgi:hypothetical protein